MNHIELSGRLVGNPVEERDFLCCTLQFTKHLDRVKVVATGAAADKLACFTAGEGIKITGSLIRHKTSGVMGVLAETVESWRVAIPKQDARYFGGQDELRQVYLGDAAKGKQQSWR